MLGRLPMIGKAMVKPKLNVSLETCHLCNCPNHTGNQRRENELAWHMTLLPLCHNIDEEGNRSRCWDTDKVRIRHSPRHPNISMKYPSLSQSVQIQSKACFQLAELTTFSLKSNCIFSPPPSAIKETNVIATRRIWPFFILSSSSSHSKNECPNFQGRNTKNGNPNGCGWKKTVLPWKKNDKHDFFWSVHDVFAVIFTEYTVLEVHWQVEVCAKQNTCSLTSLQCVISVLCLSYLTATPQHTNIKCHNPVGQQNGKDHVDIKLCWPTRMLRAWRS